MIMFWLPLVVLALLAIILTTGSWLFTDTHQVVEIEMRPHPPQPRPAPYEFEFKRAEELWDRDHI